MVWVGGLREQEEGRYRTGFGALDILAGLTEGKKHPEEREGSQQTGGTRDRGLGLAA